MASKTVATGTILLANLLFVTMVSSTHVLCPPPPPKTLKYPSPPSPAAAACPKDTLKLGVCANLLNDLLHLAVGTPPKTPCCSLIEGLADLEAAVCLCTAIKANILGINLNVPISLSLLLNYCGKGVPKGCPKRLPMCLEHIVLAPATLVFLVLFSCVWPLFRSLSSILIGIRLSPSLAAG